MIFMMTRLVVVITERPIYAGRGQTLLYLRDQCGAVVYVVPDR